MWWAFERERGSPSRRKHSRFEGGNVDTVDGETRTRIMASVRREDTRGELRIRKALHARGLRFRLHAKELPGTPDIVLPRHRTVVMVHGCFWHGHDCHLFRLPRTRRAFWQEKVERNRRRDADVRNALISAGWRCLTVWECALHGREKLEFGPMMDEVATWIRSAGRTAEWRGAE